LAAARSAYEKALEVDPQLAAAWTNLGSMRAEADDLDGARDYFDRALRCDPEQPEAQVNLAELALRQGDMEVAIVGYRQVLRAAPDHPEAHYGLARALIAVGGKAQALAHLERFCGAVENVPKKDRDPSLEARHRRALDVIESLREDLASG
jgi:tetratricopeptide (TPR) repeat protein